MDPIVTQSVNNLLGECEPMYFLATKCKNIIVNDMANFSEMPTKPNKCASAEAASRDQGGANCAARALITMIVSSKFLM